MKYFVMFIWALFLSVSTCQKKVENVIFESRMISIEDTLSRHQLDSTFIADTLSFNIEDDWITSQVISEDRKELLYKYVYIKSLTDTTGTIYTLYTYQDTLFILNKRIVE